MGFKPFFPINSKLHVLQPKSVVIDEDHFVSDFMERSSETGVYTNGAFGKGV